MVHEMRLFKSEEELNVTPRGRNQRPAHTRAMEKCRPGMFEYQLEGEIHHEFNRHGARFPSYNTIVGGGENGCILHYTENESELRDGDLVLIDAGCEYQGYAGDITRTFPVNGKFTTAQREIYDIVLESLETALTLFRSHLHSGGYGRGGTHHDYRAGEARHSERRCGHPYNRKRPSSVLYARPEPLAGAGCA